MRYKELVDEIQRYEQKYAYEERIAPWSYLKTVEKIRDVRENLVVYGPEKIKLCLQGIIKPFLVHWGKMGRVVQRASDRDWETLAWTLGLLDFKGEFQRLRKKVGKYTIFRDLIAIDLNENREVANSVRIIYGKLRLVPYLGGPTCISKILHLLNPHIFAMWDSDIRKMYAKKWDWNVDVSAEGYLAFLRMVKWELEEVFKDYCLYAPMVKSYVELSGQEKLEVLERAKWRCEWCGFNKALIIDRATPVLKGGSHKLSNARVLCVKCKLSIDHDHKTLVKLADEYNWSKAHTK